MARGPKGALGRLEKGLDRGKVALKTRLGLWRRPEVQVFRGHGTPSRVRVSGRVVEETGTREVGAHVGLVRNAVNAFRRMESDELPRARLRVRMCGLEHEVETDDEGFFALDLACDGGEPGWHEVDVELISSPSGHRDVRGRGEVLLVPERCELGIVSDLDDTVIETGARNQVTHTRVLLARDALEQVAFPGVADFYRRLIGGADGRAELPIFYVSRSSWGLYDLFVDVMASHDIPKGPMFLMDAAVIEEKSSAVGHADHKLDTIAEILELHRHMRLVLIGDSGQHDPEAYLEAVRRWPDRVRAVYLRDVTKGKRDREVRSLVQQIEAQGIHAAACETTAEMARHAEREGLIPA